MNNYQSFFASFCSQKEEKVFFFEKKKQKTFVNFTSLLTFESPHS